MAHFAQLNENNIVVQVIVVNNNDIIDDTGKESEQKGIEFCKELFGSDTRWVQTSYNNNFRVRFAGVGSLYREDLDAFIPEKFFPSWILNLETFNWEPPIPKPNSILTDSFFTDFYWNEESISWKSFTINSPYPSWIFDEETKNWIAPTHKPFPEETETEYIDYEWNETNLTWEQIVIPK